MRFTVMRFTVMVFGLLLVSAVSASEAPRDMSEFNRLCPFNARFPAFDRAYHECGHGFDNGSCEAFVDGLATLLPEYDCQREFDATGEINYIVPAIWLAGSAASEDYFQLLYRLARDDDAMYRGQRLAGAKAVARRLFLSQEFEAVLDGDIAETFIPIIETMRGKAR